MFEINAYFCTRNRGKWIAEASDLGFPPGRWPNRIRLNISPGMYFEYHEPRPILDREGDVMVYVYRSTNGGAELHILND